MIEMSALKVRLFNVLVALDQLAWVVLTLGKGHPDETISAAMWRMEQEGKIAGRALRPIIDWISRPLEKDHCYLSWLSEKNGRQLHPSYRES